MVVAVVPMRMVQVVADEVVHVVAVRHHVVPAAGAVLVIALVMRAVVIGRAVGWVAVADRNRVSLHFIALVVVKLAVVQVIDVVVVAYRRMPAVGTVLVVVLIGHGSPFS